MAQVVEQWIDRARCYRDLFYLFDVLAIRRDTGVIGIQSTTDSCLAGHRRALLQHPNLVTWLAGGARCQLWAWRTVGTGERPRWHSRIEEAFLVEGGIVEFRVQATPPTSALLRDIKSRWKRLHATSLPLTANPHAADNPSSTR